MSRDERSAFSVRHLTGAEKAATEETDIDAEEAAAPPDSTLSEFTRGVTDLDLAKEEPAVDPDKKVRRFALA